MINKYKLVDFKTLGDDRGSLVALEKGGSIPFDIKRVYYIFDTKKHITRGGHAHINLKQMIVSVKGSCTFVIDNGRKKIEIELCNPNEGLLIEGLIWREMKNFSKDCVLVVLASEYYDESDYIRNYEDFKKKVGSAKN
jgi:dTDP-4-dehydrorhamnose 3,5-epimerase-like enzyme